MRYHRVPLSTFLRPAFRALLLYWGVLSLTFALLRLAPGDPTVFLLPPGASAADVEQLRTELGLDRSLPVQYARWVKESLGGSTSVSFTDRRPVRAVIADALPISLALGVASILLSFIVGTLVGLVQSARHGRPLDTLLTVFSVVLAASPAYWLGLGAIACFTYLASSWSLPLAFRLPAIGLSTPGAELHGLR